MKNFNNKLHQLIEMSVAGEKMTVERAIHFAIFTLLLVGLCGISAWASYSYLNNNMILEIAGLALSWGVILLILYLGFRQLNWEWWS